MIGKKLQKNEENAFFFSTRNTKTYIIDKHLLEFNINNNILLHAYLIILGSLFFEPLLKLWSAMTGFIMLANPFFFFTMSIVNDNTFIYSYPSSLLSSVNKRLSASRTIFLMPGQSTTLNEHSKIVYNQKSMAAFRTTYSLI